MEYAKIKKYVYLLLDPYQGGILGRIVDLAIMALILLSVVGIMLETVDTVDQTYGQYLWYFEVFSIVVFTAEYLGRLWSITTSQKYRDPVTGRIRYAMTPYMIVDLLAILPFYVGGVMDLRFLRILRIFRIFRVVKVARYSSSLQTMGIVARKKKEELVISVIVAGVLLVLASSMMYIVEHPHQPEAFSSIPRTFWWGVITLTTVGYGDTVPVTTAGQLLAGVFAVIGVGLFALPASILASGFIEEATADEEDHTEWDYCPHCGEEL